MLRHWVDGRNRRAITLQAPRAWSGDVRRIYSDGSVATSRDETLLQDAKGNQNNGQGDPQSAAVFAAFDAEPRLRSVVLLPSRAR
jgi:hypothetical protein